MLKQVSQVADGNVQPEKSPIYIREFRTFQQAHDVLKPAERELNECMPGQVFNPEYTLKQLHNILGDIERTELNAWLAYRDEECIGYGYGRLQSQIFSPIQTAILQLLYVVPEHRGSWAALKIVRRWEEWARMGNAVYMSLGVERLDQDEAKHIRKMFPKLGFRWAGSFYIKEVK